MHLWPCLEDLRRLKPSPSEATPIPLVWVGFWFTRKSLQHVQPGENSRHAGLDPDYSPLQEIDSRQPTVHPTPMKLRCLTTVLCFSHRNCRFLRQRPDIFKKKLKYFTIIEIRHFSVQDESCWITKNVSVRAPLRQSSPRIVRCSVYNSSNVGKNLYILPQSRRHIHIVLQAPNEESCTYT